MDSIKRYKGQLFHQGAYICEYDGSDIEWVRADEFDRLQSRLVEVKAENDRLNHVSEEGTACANCHDPSHALIEQQLTIARQEHKERLEEMWEKVNSLISEVNHWRNAHEVALKSGDLARQELAGAREESEQRLNQVLALLDHCPDAECSKCGQIVCPDGDEMHFHHDGCPSCEFGPTKETAGG